MNEVLEELINQLSLEPIENNIFRGQSQDPGWGRVFGGQVIGQALSAARQTVDPARHVHSFHSYFLREGDSSKPIVYTVDCIRDGRSFTTRRVVAVQNGKPIFNLSASFHIDEPGYEHQDKMPDVIAPEEAMSETELGEKYIDLIPAGMKKHLSTAKPIEIRFADPLDPMADNGRAPNHKIWIRANGQLPDNSGLHKYLLAYASDFQFLSASLYPHGGAGFQKPIQIASLDHAMWFHRPFRMDEWLLHCVESTTAHGARALVRGQIFNQAGELVASTTQEGLIRELKNSEKQTF
ncbi:acyl-CoA thioesterase II [Endozoicomonas ascidiicola]|uniref:acyl-CoA thioesterase II n=1 Tax=Endozoicomonas ascidiicola TaxID=1698521 RepID=UPI00082A92C7|nr:acyl-CoA thioesterase II [Endozoicomonas ascidiicola]